jgi:hypothetical protein
MGLSSAFGLLLCTLRPLLWRALAISVTSLALALLANLAANIVYETAASLAVAIATQRRLRPAPFLFLMLSWRL